MNSRSYYLLLLLMLMEQLKLNFYVSRTDTLSEVLEPHKNVFHKKLGIIERFKTDIKLQDVAKPVFCKARPVPYAWCIPMWKKMDLLESPEVVEKVERSDWTSPIVRVPKSDRSLRICGGFKGSVNQVLLDNSYPEDLFVTLGSGMQN